MKPTGVWADGVRAMDEGSHPNAIRPAKGIHVTVRAEKLPCDFATVLTDVGQRNGQVDNLIGLYAIAVRSLAVLRESLRRGSLSFAAHEGFVLAHFPPALGVGGWVFTETPERLPWRAPK